MTPIGSHIMKTFLTHLKCSEPSRHHINILACGLELKRPINWPGILLAIIATFESPQHNIKCLFLRIRKIKTMVCFLLSQSTHKNNIIYYKTSKVTIDAPNFEEAISNVVIYHHNFSDLAIVMEAFSNNVVRYYDFLRLVVTDSNVLYANEICYYYAIFQTLDVVILPHFIYKVAALLKSQIAANGAYFQAFAILNLDDW